MLQTTLKRQAGVTAISWMVLAVISGFLVMFGLKVFPVYMENFSVNASLKSLTEDGEVAGMTTQQIRSTLIKRLGINNVDRVKSEDIIIERDRSEYVVNISYEVRQHFLGNIDFLITFDDTVRVPAR